MNIYIRSYQNHVSQFGNVSTDMIFVKDNSILISELKDILSEKYKIHPSKQRLTFKIADEFLVMLTNEWPLSYFHIKENSHIYLEILEELNQQEQINKKIMSATKSKYLKSLGFFNHFTSNLGVIPESSNEYNDEIFSYKKSKINTNNNNKKSSLFNNSNNNGNKSISHNKDSFTEDEQIEVILIAVKNNNINQLRELFDQNEVIDINRLGNNGWAAIHTASYYGFTEIVVELLAKKANPNILNKEKWSSLHLACYKGNEEVVKVLINAPNINLDVCTEDIGTPLHCASKRNCVKIVALLLFKANTEIKDSNGNKACDIATDKNINKLFLRHKKCKNQKNEPDINQIEVLKSLPFIPPKPPKTFGFVEKLGRIIFSFNLRFMELDALGGVLKRYKCIQDYPSKPNEIVPLRDISLCKKLDSFYYSNNYTYFELNYEQRQIYRIPKDSSCLQWLENLNAAIIYSKFFSDIMSKHSELVQYFSKLKEESLYIEFEEKIDEIFINSKAYNLTKPSNFKNNISTKDTKKIENDKKQIKENTLKDTKINRQRRKNPYTSVEEDTKLVEDSETHGITFSSFDILATLGSGSFGKVYKVKLKNTNQIFAMKVINKKYLIKNQQLRYAVTECNVLKLLNHPFIIKLHYAFQTPDHLYMILDYCPGGDLSYHIVKNLFEEDEAQFFIAELILAVEHLHSHDIIYRDLKPENILIDGDGHIKLADFGLAKEGVGNDRTTQSFCGSPAYLSPEMVNRRGVGKSADIYGIGAVLYEMISGTPPFYANDLGTMYRNIAKSKLMMHDYFSPELQNLLKKLLNRDPKVRIGVNNKDEIKNHEFFKELDWEKLYKRKIKPVINLNEFKNDIDTSMYETSKDKYNINKKKTPFTDIDYTSNNTDFNRVKNYTFIRDNKNNNNS